MNKNRQRELTQWLKHHSMPARTGLRLSLLLGSLSGVLIIVQAWILATLLHDLIIGHLPRQQLIPAFLWLLVIFTLRAFLSGWRERVGFHCGQRVRQYLRTLIFDRLEQLGPAWIRHKPAGAWASLILEQIEDMQEFYARYLPQMYLAVTIPLLLLLAIFPINWAAALILFVTAPLIPLFMALVGMGAADANRLNFQALARLSGHFLDRLKGLDTLRLFHRAQITTENVTQASESFRQRTMEVLRLAFLSSAVLEFFSSVSIAVVAMYFGFSYLGELNFGSYHTEVTLFAGFLVLILAPEFFQPLRDLGIFYHAKAQAIGAAESLVTFLEQTPQQSPHPVDTEALCYTKPCHLQATELEILSPQGTVLAGPLSFTVAPNDRIALVGFSGAGKSSLIAVLLGFLPYRGSLTLNGVELNTLSMTHWRQQLGWVGQNPHLPETTLRANVLLGYPQASEQQLNAALEQAYVTEFLPLLPQGIETDLGEGAFRLSVGQAQRVAVARALIRPCRLLLLDEPTASLDAHSEHLVMKSLQDATHRQTTLLVTHQLTELATYQQIWVMDNGRLVQQGTYHTLQHQNGPFTQLLATRRQEW